MTPPNCPGCTYTRLQDHHLASCEHSLTARFYKQSTGSGVAAQGTAMTKIVETFEHFNAEGKPVSNNEQIAKTVRTYTEEEEQTTAPQSH